MLNVKATVTLHMGKERNEGNDVQLKNAIFMFYLSALQSIFRLQHDLPHRSEPYAPCNSVWRDRAVWKGIMQKRKR